MMGAVSGSVPDLLHCTGTWTIAANTMGNSRVGTTNHSNDERDAVGATPLKLMICALSPRPSHADERGLP